jgi:hypothetical protein
MFRQQDPLVLSFDNATDAANDTIRDYHYQLKATLTNILNEDRMKHNPNGAAVCRRYYWETNKTCQNKDIPSVLVLISEQGYFDCTINTRVNAYVSSRFH